MGKKFVVGAFLIGMALGFVAFKPLTQPQFGEQGPSTNMANLVWGPSRGMMAPSRMSHVASAKKGIHPEWYPAAKVIVNGKEVFSVGGSKEEYKVDIWSGNHPFWEEDKTKTKVLDDSEIRSFGNRYG